MEKEDFLLNSTEDLYVYSVFLFIYFVHSFTLTFFLSYILTLLVVPINREHYTQYCRTRKRSSPENRTETQRNTDIVYFIVLGNVVHTIIFHFRFVNKNLHVQEDFDQVSLTKSSSRIIPGLHHPTYYITVTTIYSILGLRERGRF